MNQTRRIFLKKSLLGFFLSVTALVLLAAKKIFEYSSAPVGDKNCDFIYPTDERQTQSTTGVAHPATSSFGLDQSGGFINDASCLNKTPIYGIVRVRAVADIRNALRFARENQIKVTVAGQRHSMGGQSFSKDGLVLDMRDLNKISVSKENLVLTTQSGATWAQIQSLLDVDSLSVKAMQSINVPTVGGTLSVNAHGIAHDPGQIAPTVRHLSIMLSDGEIKVASRSENPELFRLAIGGYGLFGVILDAELDVVANDVYEWKTQYMNYTDFREYYDKNVARKNNIGLSYGRLSMSPSSYLTETAFHTYDI